MPKSVRDYTPAELMDGLNKMNKGTLMETIGLRFLEPVDGNLRATLPVDARTVQPMGLLHGGASAALAETLGSAASWLRIDNDTHYSAGLEINANHLRPVTEGEVTGTCYPVHIGAGTHVWDIRIHDDQGRLACISRLTVAVRRKRG